MQKLPWRDYLENVLLAILLALVVRTFVVSGYKVPNHSMAPTIQAGDFIFAWRLPYGVKIPLLQVKLWSQMPKRGDIVVFSFPEQPRKVYVKRVVGLPGDTIQIKADRVLLNGEELKYEPIEIPTPSEEVLGFEAVGGIRLAKESAPEGDRRVVLPEVGKSQEFALFQVPVGQIFLLGDHRATSDDSRYWGSVPYERVDGRVFMTWMSLRWKNAQGNLSWPEVRWDRVLTSVK